MGTRRQVHRPLADAGLGVDLDGIAGLPRAHRRGVFGRAGQHHAAGGDLELLVWRRHQQGLGSDDFDDPGSYSSDFSGLVGRAAQPGAGAVS